MPEQPPTPAELLRLILERSEATLMERIEQELASQTYVGGKRVRVQPLPKLPRNASRTVHHVKVSLHGAKPPVWRRLEFPSNMSLDNVHEVLLVAFDWHGYHLHSFETVNGEYGPPDADESLRHKDESAVALGQVALAEGAKLIYTYDFGDDWRHDIVVEKIVPAEPGIAYPRCAAGRLWAPHEDSGGIWAWNERPADQERERFDPSAVTEALSGLAHVVIPPR